MHEFTKMRARTCHRVGTMTLKLTPLSKQKTRFGETGNKNEAKNEDGNIAENEDENGHEDPDEEKLTGGLRRGAHE